MRNWCSRHPVWFMAFYALFYLTFFALLERTIQSPDLWVHCRLDDLIPFCKYAIVPYLLWFPWIPFTLFYLLYKAPRGDFWRLCLPLFTGMTMALLFYAIVPNGLALRPRFVPGSDIFARLVRAIYRSDTPMNVCPSIHVFNSVTLMLAYYRSSIFDAPRRRWMRPAAMVLCVSITMSTMLLKQHSVIDVVFGLLLALTLAQRCKACPQDADACRSGCKTKHPLPVFAVQAGGVLLFMVKRGLLLFRYSAYTKMPATIMTSAAIFLGFIFSWKIVTPKIVT